MKVVFFSYFVFGFGYGPQSTDWIRKQVWNGPLLAVETRPARVFKAVTVAFIVIFSLGGVWSVGNLWGYDDLKVSPPRVV